MTDEPRRTEVAKSILLGCGAWLAEPFTASAVAAAISSALAKSADRASRTPRAH